MKYANSATLIYLLNQQSTLTLTIIQSCICGMGLNVGLKSQLNGRYELGLGRSLEALHSKPKRVLKFVFINQSFISATIILHYRSEIRVGWDATHFISNLQLDTSHKLVHLFIMSHC